MHHFLPAHMPCRHSYRDYDSDSESDFFRDCRASRRRRAPVCKSWIARLLEVVGTMIFVTIELLGSIVLVLGLMVGAGYLYLCATNPASLTGDFEQITSLSLVAAARAAAAVAACTLEILMRITAVLANALTDELNRANAMLAAQIHRTFEEFAANFTKV
jgi:hypothetical protein